MNKSSRNGLHEQNIGIIEFPTKIIDSFPITKPEHSRRESILTENEQNHTPSHKQYQVSQTSASLVMFDVMNDRQGTEKFNTGIGSYYFGASQRLHTGMTQQELHLTGGNSSIGHYSDNNNGQHASNLRNSRPVQSLTFPKPFAQHSSYSMK